ncbi:MAG: protein kinase [Planctomycetota bacterium]
MNPQEWQRVNELFTQALELPADERSAFLSRACPDEPVLREEVEKLLASDAENADRGLLEPGAFNIKALYGAHSRDPLVGRVIGNYRLAEKIGEGAFGSVYLAEQSSPLQRRVALKILHAGLDTSQALARFEAERQALALMEHPHVAKVYDAGTTEEGQPYFVMEFVPGIPITEHCDRHRLEITDRLNLFMQVCDAVQHAHQKGIIHRDIKPSNVLVALDGEKSIPKVIDFGVAKAVVHRLTERTLFTEQGVLIGTPEYMSPEQAEMTNQDVDKRTDVYSLGVLLYELLSGALPFDPRTLRQQAFDQMVRMIREVDPPKPSTRLSMLVEGARDPMAKRLVPVGVPPPHSAVRGEMASAEIIAKHRRIDPKTLVRRLRGDLDWITLKALEKDRQRRYTSPADLAADILRHLNSQPIVAGPPSLAYRTKKLVVRHKTSFSAAAGFVLVLTLVVVVSRAQETTLKTRISVGEQQKKVIEDQVARQKEFETILKEADVLHDNHFFPDAKARYESALKVNPDSDKAHRKLAETMLDWYFATPFPSRPSRRNLLHEADEAFKIATGLNPSGAGHRNARGVALCVAGDLTAAEACFREALRLDPRMFHALSNLAKVLAMQSRFEEAMASALAGTEFIADKTEPSNSNDGIWLTRGTLEMHLGDWKAAKKSLETARSIDSDDSRNILVLAKYYLRAPQGLRDYHEAFMKAETANSVKDPWAYPQLHRILAEAFLRTGRYHDAIQFAGQAIREGDSSTINKLFIGLAQAKLGNESEAETILGKTQENWPPEEFASNPTMANSASYEMLWIDTLDELNLLKNELESELGRLP